MTLITTADLDQIIINYKDVTIGSTATRLQWYNFLNTFTRDELIQLNPNDYLQTRTIKTLSGISEYALPSTFESTQVGGIFFTTGSTNGTVDSGAINYDAEAVAFTTVPQTVTSSSGGSATLAEIVDYTGSGTLRLTGITGDFDDNDTLTGSAEGSVTANGAIKQFKFTDRKFEETDFGSQDFGYFEDGTNLTLTPTPKSSEVYIMRYIPELTELTTIDDNATTGTTVLPIKFKEYARNATEIFLQQYREKQNMEILASERFQGALRNLIDKAKKTTKMIRFNPRKGFRRHQHRHHHHFPC